MKASQYKAIRDAGVGAFAIYPVDVERRLPSHIDHANKAESVRACPTGLVQAEIVKDDVVWSEAFTLGCGDTEYQRKRRNGVLVELALDDFRRHLGGKVTVKALGELPRTKVTRRDGSRYVQMIVSKGAIMAPWGEYAMIEAEREKARAQEEERTHRLNAAVEAVGGRHGRYTEIEGEWDEKKRERLPPDEFDYATTFDWRWRENRLAYLQGEVVLSLSRAEEIAELLGTTGVTP